MEFGIYMAGIPSDLAQILETTRDEDGFWDNIAGPIWKWKLHVASFH